MAVSSPLAASRNRSLNLLCTGKAFFSSGKMFRASSSVEFRTICKPGRVCSQCSVFWPGSFGLAGVPWKQITRYLENATISGSSIWSIFPINRARALSGGQYSTRRFCSRYSSAERRPAVQCRLTCSHPPSPKRDVALVISMGWSKFRSLPLCSLSRSSFAEVFLALVFLAWSFGMDFTRYFPGVNSFGTSVAWRSSTILAASRTFCSCTTVFSRNLTTFPSSFFSFAYANRPLTCSWVFTLSSVFSIVNVLLSFRVCCAATL
mmetsp:Transcript_21842/g.49753  ORF Transcript_21842/g.49753 Transcript_21842/m.49753 type:complete len:263 (+) Transcript_21842:953-1741(+)